MCGSCNNHRVYYDSDDSGKRHRKHKKHHKKDKKRHGCRHCNGGGCGHCRGNIYGCSSCVRPCSSC